MRQILRDHFMPLKLYQGPLPNAVWRAFTVELAGPLCVLKYACQSCISSALPARCRAFGNVLRRKRQTQSARRLPPSPMVWLVTEKIHHWR